MTEGGQEQDVLVNILRVLERIETKLNSHEERVRHLERTVSPSDGVAQQEKEWETETADTLIKSEDKKESLGPAETAEILKDDANSRLEKDMPRVPYGDWSIDRFVKGIQQNAYDDWSAAGAQLDQFYALTDLPPDLGRRMGCTWDLPDDNRFPLKFFKSNILRMHVAGGGPGIETMSRLKRRIEREMTELCNFDQELRKHSGNDFVVVDFDRYNNARMYRIGQAVVGPELLVDAGDAQNAPWSRLILYQGVTTGDSIDTERKKPEQPIPYFSRTDRIVGVWDHLSYHLQLQNRSITSNPYQSPWIGFHTTFYEIMETTELKQKELWKHGPLYDHPLGWQFRKCAFTLYAPATAEVMNQAPEDSNRPPLSPARHWTLLVLAPNGFFNQHSTMFPSKTADIGFKTTQTTIDPLGKLTQAGAELKFIGQGLEKISDRWADFQAYFDYMLDGGNSLMQPTEHDNLLFDDGAFSRSRKYFWAIDCLTEFDNSLGDNIAQWQQYRVARIIPIAHMLPEVELRLLEQVERQCRILENQQESFRQKLTAIRALRDALFNASAVIESRASTRLGENVKLLTFVSIFFLPLSFTTSLWSINDTFSLHVLIYVIIIVALVTYLTMFNINNLVENFGTLYNSKKKRIVRAMKADPNKAWSQTGRRFEVFRPKHENPEPSEWLIPLFMLLRPHVLFGLGHASTRTDAPRSNSAGAPERQSLFSLALWFRTRKQPRQAAFRTDEGWVL